MTPSTSSSVPAAPQAEHSLTRSQRLDRLPFTRKHGKLLGASGIGWALDAMDVGLISFVIAALSVHWGISKGDGSLIASAGFAGMAIGASVGGLLADRIGRRSVFALTLLVYGLATGGSALAMGVGTLIVLRFVVGLGLGAELPVASTLMSEFAPARIRGRVIVWLEAFWALGWILAAVIGTFVAASGPTGWRWALAVGLVPAAYSLVVRWGMPESVRFLEQKGRHDEAEPCVRSFEEAAEQSARGQTADGPSGTVGAEPAPGAAQRGSEASERVRRRFGPRLPTPWARSLRPTPSRAPAASGRVRCAGAPPACGPYGSASILAYYGAFIWIPTLLVERGFTLTQSFTFTLIITLAQIPGYAMAAWLIEVLGRRWTLTVFLTGSALSAIGYGLADSEATIIAAGCALSFFNLGAWGALYAIGPELYPTAVRGTGTGAAAAFGRIASMLAPFLVPVLVVAGGQTLAFVCFAIAFALAAAAAFTLPEQRGRALAQ